MTNSAASEPLTPAALDHPGAGDEAERRDHAEAAERADVVADAVLEDLVPKGEPGDRKREPGDEPAEPDAREDRRAAPRQPRPRRASRRC